MIQARELRLGNYILHKVNNKISTTACDYRHFELLARGDNKDMFPILLKPDWLERTGFVENKKYVLLPDAHEYILTLPVPGSSRNEILAYIKNNKECFARAVADNLVVSTSIYNLHQLQNLYYSLTGKELEIK
jgi:hypothetical protein